MPDDELFKLMSERKDLFKNAAIASSDRWHVCICEKYPYYCVVYEDGKINFLKHNESSEDVLSDPEFPQNVKDFIIFNLDLFKNSNL